MIILPGNDMEEEWRYVVMAKERVGGKRVITDQG